MPAPDWTVTAVLALTCGVGAFAIGGHIRPGSRSLTQAHGAMELPAASAGPRAPDDDTVDDRARRPRPPRSHAVGRSPLATSDSDGLESPSLEIDEGLSLFEAVNAEFPVEGPLTWRMIKRAAFRAVEDIRAESGAITDVCDPDHTVGPASEIQVRWSVSSRADEIRVSGGQIVDGDVADVAPHVRACLGKYFRDVEVSAAPIGNLPFVDLDILYESSVPLIVFRANPEESISK